MATPLPTGIIPTTMTTANGYLYINGNDFNLYRISASTPVIAGSATLLCNLNIITYQMTIANNILYASNSYINPGSIIQVDLSTNIVSTFYSSGLYSPRGIVVIGDYLYVIDANTSSFDTSLYQIQISTNTLTATVDYGTTGILIYAGGMATDGTYLYIPSTSNPSNAYVSRQSLSDFTLGGFTQLWLDLNSGQIPSLNGIRNPILYHNGHLYITYNANGAPNNDLVAEILPSDSPTITNNNLLPDITVQNYDLNEYITSLAVASGQIYASFNNDDGIPYYIVYGMTIPGNATVACFLEGTTILCIRDGERTYRPIEKLQKGDLVVTKKHGSLPIAALGVSKIVSSPEVEEGNSLFCCPKESYPELFEDLILTGWHSILVDQLSEEEKKQTRSKMKGKLYMTDDKFRLFSCLDKRAKRYNESGIYHVYHLALESEDIYINHAIFANGLLVESCSQWYLSSIKSGMRLIQ